jgi:hypothetical protein
MKKIIVKVPYLSLFELFVHQRSSLWNQIRNSNDCLYFGASQVGTIVGVNPYNSFPNFWKTKLSQALSTDLDIECYIPEVKTTKSYLIDIPNNKTKEEESKDLHKAVLVEQSKTLNNCNSFACEKDHYNELILRGNLINFKKNIAPSNMYTMQSNSYTNKFLKAASNNGIKYEPLAINVFENLTNYRVIRNLGMLRHATLPFLGGSPDGYIPDINSGLEIKVPFMKDSNAKFPDDVTLIKDYIFLQCLTLLSIFRCNVWLLFYFDPKSKAYSMFEINDSENFFDSHIRFKLEEFYTKYLDACEFIRINNCLTDNYTIPRLFDRKSKRIFTQELQDYKLKHCKLLMSGYIEDDYVEAHRQNAPDVIKKNNHHQNQTQNKKAAGNFTTIPINSNKNQTTNTTTSNKLLHHHDMVNNNNNLKSSYSKYQ